jgi:hypothetical protein
MIVLHIIGIYLIGFFITLTFFKFFGKQFGFDSDQYDWNSNEEGYTILSCIWFITIIVLIIRSIVKLVQKFTAWYLKL